MDTEKLIPYLDPIYRFCRKRLYDSHEAEELASDIIAATLEGMNKYEIRSLDAWVWRIAHNRYARHIDSRKKSRELFADNIQSIAEEIIDENDSPDERSDGIFRALHTLAAEYRGIFIDRYVYDLKIKELAEKYKLTETTVKWRLNVSREKIRGKIERIGNNMEKIYKRLNWDTKTCDGNMDPDMYLHTQLARAICSAAYDRPVTVEEISEITGVPAMYIEDTLPMLEYGDAIRRVGGKYQTDFIIFSLENRRAVEAVSGELIAKIADKLECQLKENEERLADIGFYGAESGIRSLGYILVPYIMRKKKREILVKLQAMPARITPVAFPQRKDGGYGWFLVSETPDSEERLPENAVGCNVAEGSEGYIYYYWMGKYFDNSLYHGYGTRKLTSLGIPERAVCGIIPKGAVTDEDAAHFMENGLLLRDGEDYKLGFASFTREQFDDAVSLFDLDDAELDTLITDYILSVRRSFKAFTPKHLDLQIDQWVGYYVGELIGAVIAELIDRGTLKMPQDLLTDCIFHVKGACMFI